MQEARERVLVGASVELLALDLLRRDVRRRAERQAGIEARRLLGQPAREPEVGEVDVLALVEEHVRGLHVTVDQARLVGGVERGGDLRADLIARRRVELPLVGKELLQITAVGEAHDEVQLAVDLARVVDRDDIRMLE